MSSYPANADYNGLTRPIVTLWKGLLERARESKKRFNAVSDQVMSFYSGGHGAMWSSDYMARFMGGAPAITAPRFKVTMNLAFEQVAVLGPLLFWEMADRKVTPHRSVQLDPTVLAGNNPEMQQYVEQLAQEQAMDDARNDMRAKLLEHILNYFQREQPAGGLTAHSDLSIFEALTKGAGFLKTEHYQYPFSDRTLVGSFFVSVDDVLVDPDCTDPLWQTANWVAIRHRTRASETERHFNLPTGSLRAYGVASTPSGTVKTNDKSDDEKVEKDLVEWYEIFSRAGFGNKLVGRHTQPPIAPEFDAARGFAIVDGKAVPDDFAYLCICPHCTYPLNMPSEMFEDEAATAEWIKEASNWPTEYWRDNKWPVEMLYFYPHSGKSPWPEPPLAPAIGELTCLNILMSSYVQQAYEGRQQVIAYKKGAIDDLQNLLTSERSPLALPVDPQFASGSMRQAVEDCIAFMKRPEINGDLIASIEFLIMQVQKRTGLMDMLYGMNSGANPRSATEYQGKMDTINIRPEHMQKKVAAWQGRVAEKEVLCAYSHVDSDDIKEQLGPLGIQAWDMLIKSEPEETVLRGAQATVEASGIARPNKRKDMGDLQQLQQVLLPILQGHLAQTGDPNPLNGFLKAIGRAGEMEVDEFLIPEMPPNESNQAMQDAELQKTQAEAEKLMAEAEKAKAEAEGLLSGDNGQRDAEIKAQQAEHQMSIKERQAQLQSESKQLEMAHKQEMHAQTMEQRRQEAQQKLAMQLMQNRQKMEQNAISHDHQMELADDRTRQDAQRSNMISATRMLQSQAEHAMRMQQQGSGNGQD